MSKIVKTALIILATATIGIGCGGKTDKTSKAQNAAPQGNIETRVANLELRVAQLEKGGGGGAAGAGAGGLFGKNNPMGDYIQTNPKELAENASSFNNQKIRFGGKVKSLDLENNTMVMARADNEVKIDLSALPEPFKVKLKEIDLKSETPDRVVVMGTFKDGVLFAERVRVMAQNSMMGGQGGDGEPGAGRMQGAGPGAGPGMMGGRGGQRGRFLPPQGSGGNNNQ